MKDLHLLDSPLKDFGKGVTQESDLVEAIKTKLASYSDASRSLLVSVFKNQLGDLSPKESASLKALEEGATTVVTGHQLMVCGGTAFFEIKILSAVALAKEAARISGTSVVPVFWMATEDHDFEEIASFRVNGQRFVWQQEGIGGPVGRLATNGLADQLEAFLITAKLTETQRSFLQRRLHHYQSEPTLAAATRAIVREWAADFGVLVLDGDDAQLKTLAQPLWDQEMQGTLAKKIQATTAALEQRGYRAQVFPREINLFEIGEQKRERITAYKDLDAPSISPNALMRPVYQEWVLPNIAYVGGGGELAYWLQLGGVFDHLELPMPRLYLRDSVAAISYKTIETVSKLALSTEDVLSRSKEELVKTYIESKHSYATESVTLNSSLEAALKSWANTLVHSYPELEVHAEAMKTQFEKTLTRSNKTRLRALKKREHIWTTRLDTVMEAIYPQGVFWERRSSYADLIGILNEDPKAALVDNMSTIKAGTYLIYPKK